MFIRSSMARRPGSAAPGTASSVERGGSPCQSRIVPGLRMPSGSRASLMARGDVDDVLADLIHQPGALEAADAVLAGDRAAEGRWRDPWSRRRASMARRSESGSAGSITISGWVLPSPAWAISATITSRSTPIRSTPATSSGSRGTGTPTSSNRSRPFRSTAGNDGATGGHEHLALDLVVGVSKNLGRGIAVAGVEQDLHLGRIAGVGLRDDDRGGGAVQAPSS